VGRIDVEIPAASTASDQRREMDADATNLQLGALSATGASDHEVPDEGYGLRKADLKQVS